VAGKIQAVDLERRGALVDGARHADIRPCRSGRKPADPAKEFEGTSHGLFTHRKCVAAYGASFQAPFCVRSVPAGCFPGPQGGFSPRQASVWLAGAWWLTIVWSVTQIVGQWWGKLPWVSAGTPVISMLKTSGA